MSTGGGEIGEARLTHESAALELYGLLEDRFRPNCARVGEEEIRWRLLRNLARLETLGVGAGIAIASECSIGIRSAFSRIVRVDMVAMVCDCGFKSIRDQL